MYEQLNIEDYQAHFVNNQDADYVLIDVREQKEFVAGHLPNAIHLPLSELNLRMDEVDKTKHIVLVCHTGVRSEMAAQALSANGYNNLYNLLEGTKGWINRGLSIEA
ncbi:MAG: rhodanese-like domain-containing protein [Anaerolineae bacterium]|nr:rhodanese-like domain-containing protein [Anaerolineae bacterium]MDQ7034104.1 rhodanese-like domain-containing protein [Anaerolineae bacterium]